MSSVVPSAPARTPLPEGTIPVGIALLLAGFATYAFFQVGTVAVGGADEFAPLLSLWFATFALAPGLFLPLEQELGRAISHRRALGPGLPTGHPEGRPPRGDDGGDRGALHRRSPARSSPVVVLRRRLVHGVALALAFVGYAPAHLARGICSGTVDSPNTRIIMGSDGVVRIVLCVVLAIIGITAVGAYGLVIAISPLFAVAYVYRRGGLQSDPGPEADWNEVTPNLGWLLLGSIFAATLLNAGPIAASAARRAENEDGLVTAFSYGVLLARIPLFLFQAVQAALLPRLSRLAARGEIEEFRAGLRRLIVVVIAVGVVGIAGSLLLGSVGDRPGVRGGPERADVGAPVVQQRLPT